MTSASPRRSASANTAWSRRSTASPCPWSTKTACSSAAPLAATAWDVTGEDVTENLRTVRNLPKTLKNAPPRLIVRGEVYMSRAVFEGAERKRAERGEQLLANPRNAAAGSMRQQDPKVAAARKLDICVFTSRRPRA